MSAAPYVTSLAAIRLRSSAALVHEDPECVCPECDLRRVLARLRIADAVCLALQDMFSNDAPPERAEARLIAWLEVDE